jgi:hypothetical protein
MGVIYIFPIIFNALFCSRALAACRRINSSFKLEGWLYMVNIFRDVDGFGLGCLGNGAHAASALKGGRRFCSFRLSRLARSWQIKYF